MYLTIIEVTRDFYHLHVNGKTGYVHDKGDGLLAEHIINFIEDNGCTMSARDVMSAVDAITQPFNFWRKQHNFSGVDKKKPENIDELSAERVESLIDEKLNEHRIGIENFINNKLKDLIKSKEIEKFNQNADETKTLLQKVKKQ